MSNGYNYGPTEGQEPEENKRSVGDVQGEDDLTEEEVDRNLEGSRERKGASFLSRLSPETRIFTSIVLISFVVFCVALAVMNQNGDSSELATSKQKQATEKYDYNKIKPKTSLAVLDAANSQEEVSEAYDRVAGASCATPFSRKSQLICEDGAIISNVDVGPFSSDLEKRRYVKTLQTELNKHFERTVVVGDKYAILLPREVPAYQASTDLGGVFAGPALYSK
ncbi:hypothetical protein ACUH96_01695 [Dermabacteraceae bacterium P13077]